MVNLDCCHLLRANVHGLMSRSASHNLVQFDVAAHLLACPLMLMCQSETISLDFSLKQRPRLWPSSLLPDLVNSLLLQTNGLYREALLSSPAPAS